MCSSTMQEQGEKVLVATMLMIQIHQGQPRLEHEDFKGEAARGTAQIGEMNHSFFESKKKPKQNHLSLLCISCELHTLWLS